MLFQVGPLTISRRPFNIEEWRRETTANWAKKELLGRSADREATGDDDSTLTLKGTLHPFNRRAFAGLSSLDMAHSLCSSQTPVFVTRGDGRPLGFYGIDSVSEAHQAIGPHTAGVGQEIEHEMKLSRIGNPGPAAGADMLSQLISLFG
jgi:phage protein U